MIGIGGSLGGASRPRPSHTTVHTGPCTAVREMTLTRVDQGRETSNSHFGAEHHVEGKCDRLNRGAIWQFAGRGESDSSAVWERSRTLYRGCGRPVRVCRTSGAGKTAITSWPISAWRRFRRFSCRARRSWPISGTWQTGTGMAARTARRCLGWGRFRAKNGHPISPWA